MDEQIYDRLYAVEDQHWWFRGRRAVIRSLLRHAEFPQPARVLDAGCGTGRDPRGPVDRLLGAPMQLEARLIAAGVRLPAGSR